MYTRATNQSEKYPADTLINISEGQIAPLVEKLFSALIRFNSARAELDTAIAAMSPTARRWLGLNFANRAAQRYRAALLDEFTRMLPTTGAPRKPDFAASRDVLERMRLALDTIPATASGGAKGRPMYRAIGSLNGVSGGLNVDHGELIALLENAAETEKLLESGAVELVTTTEV
jgi:hypothetical protein